VSSYLPAAVSASLHLLPGRLRRWWLSGPPTLMSALGRGGAGRRVAAGVRAAR
jgi:hypothetical protein